jgi:glycosyltransferase involved in cell wall biosynthesis
MSADAPAKLVALARPRVSLVVSAAPMTLLGADVDASALSGGVQGGQPELIVPATDVAGPELSIVVPAMNEAVTIEEFTRWCSTGLARAGVSGEILIVDSSDDGTAELAVAAGARVLRTRPRGLGRAYKDAIPFIRGRFVIMGDADCTYDFRELGPFIDALRGGEQFVMGSRWAGSIEPGAMPALHRYLGTPVTTWILNRLYGSHFSDIHCGMRGMTRDALIRMRLDSDSWEYASEMVLKSVKLGLRTTEVPVHFLKDREGRESHHKRSGWFSPWRAAWINLRAMFVYGSDYFVLKPGLVAFLLGLILTLTLSDGPINLGHVELSLNSQFAGVALTVVGLQAFFTGVIAQVLFDYPGRATRRWLSLFPYTRTVLAAFVTAVVGLGCLVPVVVYYFNHRGGLSIAARSQDGLAVTGLMLIVVAFSLFTFALLLHGTVIAVRRARASDDIAP